MESAAAEAEGCDDDNLSQAISNNLSQATSSSSSSDAASEAEARQAGEKKVSGQLEARRAATRAEAAERELGVAAWISRVIPRLYNEPHNIGGLLSPHLERDVVNIVLGYVVEVNGSGKLRRTDGEEVSFKVEGCASLNRLGYWATQEKTWPEVPVRVLLQGSNVELPVVGECGALMNVFTGSFPDLEVRVGAGANVYSKEDLILHSPFSV